MVQGENLEKKGGVGSIPTLADGHFSPHTYRLRLKNLAPHKAEN